MTWRASVNVPPARGSTGFTGPRENSNGLVDRSNNLGVNGAVSLRDKFDRSTSLGPNLRDSRGNMLRDSGASVSRDSGASALNRDSSVSARMRLSRASSGGSSRSARSLSKEEKAEQQQIETEFLAQHMAASYRKGKGVNVNQRSTDVESSPPPPFFCINNHPEGR